MYMSLSLSLSHSLHDESKIQAAPIQTPIGFPCELLLLLPA